MKNKQIKQHWILATDTVAGVADRFWYEIKKRGYQ